MSALQDSLDQLLQVITNSNNNESIGFDYLVERNSVDGLANDCGDLILRVSTQRNETNIVCGVRSGTSKSLIDLTHKTYEFLQAIDKLKEASTRSSGGGDICHFFLDIIHRECGHNSQMTAEKLISLQYPLWQAVKLENADIIEQMITHGCPVNDCHPFYKFTALSKAVERRNLEIVRVLIKYGADVDFVDIYRWLPIAYCYPPYTKGKQQPEIIKILLDNSKRLKVLSGDSLLCQFEGVFRNGTKEVIQMVIEYRHDIFNIRNDLGETILHYLAENEHSDIVELLTGRQLDVNIVNRKGKTPIAIAAYSSICHINTFKFLLENGANVNVRVGLRESNVPLFMLCYRTARSKDKKRYLKIIELFLQHDLDIQYVALDQTTVFDIIIRFKSFYMAEPLLAHLAILEEQGNLVTEHIRNKINSNQLLREYFELCKAEIVSIKNNSIDQGLTLHTILFNREEKIFKIYKSHLNSLSKLETLKKQCFRDHAYYATIKKRICSIAKRIELYRDAAVALCELTKSGIDVNHLVTFEIMDYLDDQDFHNLIKVTKMESVLV